MEPQTDFGWMRSPSLGIDSRLGPETDEGSDHGDPFTEILIEARETFIHKDPDFVINDPGVKRRTVEIANNEIAELTFEYWDEKRKRGFWTLDLGNQEKYIVKNFKKGRHYRAWHGLRAKYEDQPIAWQLINSKTFLRDQVDEVDGSTMGSEDWNGGVDVVQPPYLRQRSQSQIMPYTEDKINHKRALQGKPKRKEGLSYKFTQTPRNRVRQISPEQASVKKRRTSSKSDSKTPTPSGIQQDAAEETTRRMINKHTRLNTRLTATITGPSEVIYLEDALTIEELFAEVTQAWHSVITAESEVKLAVRFPWLGEEDTNSTLSVRQERPRSFDRMLEMINKAPCWREESKPECVVNVQVMVG